jgi:amino acid adenylation domain-containing protein/non-ribosomal peptide synthase protein (TIGR01720 family)
VSASAPREDRVSALPEHLQELLRQRLAGEAPGAAGDGIPRVAGDEPSPLSSAQQRLWFMYELEPDSIEYNVPRILRLRGELEVEALGGAVNRIVRRHESLRTTFDSTGGHAVQIVHPATDVPIPVLDLSEVSGEEREAETARCLLDEATRPFDLRRGPVFRIRLVRLGPREHLLVSGMHHIVTDGWSMGVFVDELAASYAAEVGGVPAEPSPLPVRYVDFAGWQGDRLSGDALDGQLAYWRRQLDELPSLELATERPRPPVRTSAGAVHTFGVPAALVYGLKDLARARGGTLFMALVASVHLLLARYSGRQDIAVATATSGRNRVELENLIGFFVNTLVLRCRVDEDGSFADLLHTVRTTVLDAFANEDVPFQRLVEVLRPERDLSRLPLVDVAVNLQNAPAGTANLPGLDVEEVPPPIVVASMDLSFDFEERDGNLTGHLGYNTDLFGAETVNAMAAHLVTLMGAITAGPDRRLADLPMLEAGEWERLTRGWSGDGEDTAQRTVPDLFAEQVARDPSATALVFGDDTLTYAELDDRANRLARLLVDRGAGPEQLVAVAVPRSIELAVALLAVLKSGAAYLPLDLGYPAERIEFMLADAAPALVVTVREKAGQLPGGTALLELDAPEVVAELRQSPGTPPTVERLLPAHPAYVIYTSGSTGKPKAVVLTHTGMRTSVLTQRERFDVGPRSRVLQFASLSFDSTFWELGMALLSGGALVLGDADQVLPGPQLVELVARQGVTHLVLPPTALAALPAGSIPDGVHIVLCGEACPPDLIRDWSPGRRMRNAYGPTETTVVATVSRPLTPADAETGTVPIGTPIPGLSGRVLDDRLRPVATGVPGELYLSGARLARGYLNRHSLTAQRFVADPFGPPGTRMYRTGDRVRWLPGGDLEYVGRTDSQVKIRGFRVELGEIEAVLGRHPGVAAAVVTVDQDDHGTRRLIAYVLPESSGRADEADWRRHVADRLPHFMVPSWFVVLDTLPLTPTGKVDRRALPAVTGVRGGGAGYVAPRTPVEKILTGVWSELLGVREVGVHDNFFDLGGDSILSLQVVSRARSEGVVLTPKQTFLRQTVAELAAELTAEPGAAAAPSAEQRPVVGSVPLTPIQHWFFDTLTDSLDRFNQAMFVELAEDTDESALAAAIAALSEQHDALRLRFTHTDGQWRQRNAAVGADAVLRRVDLSGLDKESQDARMRDAVVDAQRGFDLAEGPLVRALFFALGGRLPRLFLTAHHLVVDAVSLRLLLSDVDTAYHQALAGEQCRLGPKTTSLRQWSRRLGEHAAAGGFDDELEHWRGVEQAAARAVSLPVDEHGENTVESSRSVSVRLDAAKTRALLQTVPEVYRTQVNDVLLAALGRVLTDWTGGDTVVLDTEGHGREDLFGEIDLSRTVGWFTTLFPVALTVTPSVAPKIDWGTVLKAVKEQVRAIPRHGLGYGALRHLTESGSGLGHGPAPEISFNYLGRFDTGATGDGFYRGWCEYPGNERSPGQRRAHLLEINGIVTDGELEFSWTYSTSAHHEETVRRLADGFAAALAEIVEHCALDGAGGCTPSDFPLARLDQATVDRIAGDGRAVEDIYPLTPMQAGMLFHSLAEPGNDVYLGHFGVTIDGVTDPGVLAQAWQRVADRTPALRTAVVWEDVAEPLQVVYRDVRIPVTQLDWRDRTGNAQQDGLARLWERRRELTLDLADAPLLRMTVVRLSGTRVQLLWSAHHMMSDGWSFAEVLSDVFEQYSALQGEPGAPKVRRPYRDYVEWLGGQDQVAAREYWRRTMTGMSAPTPLPFDRSPVRAHGSRSSLEVKLRLDTERSARVYGCARDARLTVNTVVQGAWALLLSRYSGERDVCFGATVSGRPSELAGSESIIGLFVNMVPVRVEADDDSAVLPWLRRVQDGQAEARQYEHVSLTQIQGWSDVPRGGALFDSIVVFENYPYDGEAAARHGLRVGEYQGDEHTNYALTLTAYAGDELYLALGYDPALFDAATVERMVGHLETLLDAIAAAPQASLADLTILTEPERAQLITRFNNTAVAFPAARCVHELFAEQVLRTPDATAVECGDTALSFAGLDVRANRLAHHLAGLGVRPGVVVGVCVGRGVDAMVALLAVLKAGGAFVPLDPDYPPQMLAVLLAEAAAPVVITEERLTDRVSGGGARIVVLDRERAVIDRLPAEPPATTVTPEDLAYVVYTSGSTGVPKGVMVEHRNVHHMVRAWDREYGLTGMVPRSLSVSSFGVDLFFGDFLLSALFGGSMVVCPAESVANPVALVELLERSGATVMVTVPSLAKAIAQEFSWRGERRDSLRLLAVGSEGWQVGDCADVATWAGTRTRVVNAYGATETTVDSTFFDVVGESTGAGPFVPIGRPFANTRLYVVDPRLRPVPVGVAGELYIAGDGIARGYWNRAELTAQRFSTDPFVPGSTDRMYRTGDLVRWLPDGTLAFVGRADDQVKIRGFRIELGEVETALARHSAVAAAAAAVRRDEAGYSRLVGYVVPADGGAPDSGELRAWLAERLPSHATPALFMMLDALPLTPGGTVNRRALPAPDGVIDTGTPYAAPDTPTEQVLAGIWAEVLGVEVGRVGVEDNFFDLGGDSVLSIQVISRIRAALGRAPSPRQLFDTPTIATLAAMIDVGHESSDSDTAAGTVSGAAARAGGPLPLSSGQQRLWFLNDVDPDSAEFNTGFGLRLRGKLDVAAVRSALRELTARHESLRTTFANVDGNGVQVIQPDPGVEPVEVDLSDLPGPEREAALDRYLAQEIARPFDLRRGPVWRASLVSLESDEHVLALVMHHIICDGWSMGVLGKEFSACYAAAVRGADAGLPPLPVRYADYAVWQRERLSGESWDDHVSYWKGRLDGISPLDLPTDRPRQAVREAAGSVHRVELAPELLAGLKTVARRRDATLFMVLVAVTQLMLARYTGKRDIAVGTATSGRNRAELEGLIGFFVNRVVLRSQVDESWSFAEFLSAVRATVLEAFDHEEMPFDRLVEIMAPERDLGRNPLVEAMVVLQNTPSEETELPGLTVAEVPIVSQDVNHDLIVNFVEHDGELTMLIGYSTGLFDRFTIELMGRHLVRLLENVTAGPGHALRTWPMMSAPERHRIVEQWNDTAREVPRTTLPELFQAQVVTTPDAPAVVCGEDTLSYKQVNERANRLARMLIEHGARPERFVGVALARSADLVVVLLAILKTGAGYLPIDPEYPAERIEFMLADARPALLLTTSEPARSLPENGGTRIMLDDPAVLKRLSIGRADNVGDDERGTPLNPLNPAYLIYTSGSTGRPKGVVVAHRSLVNYVTRAGSAYPSLGGSVLLHSPIAFDFTVTALYGALTSGGCVHVEDLAGAAAGTRRPPTFLKATPSHLPLLTSLPEEVSPTGLLMLGGEALSGELLKRWRERHRGVEVVNHYGPTEATVGCLDYRIAPGEEIPPGRVPVGRPFWNTRVHVLDALLRPVPVNVAGELYVAGEALARGYLNRPGLTAARFVADPHDPAGGRMYRTGDLVRWRADGNLDFLGRTDDQVKIHGFRIEPGEIEAVIAAHPGVARVTVVARDDTLVAYVVIEASVPEEDLRALVARRLPAHMMPSAFVFLDAIPLSPNGKVDQAALPAPGGGEDTGTPHVAPRTTIELALAGIWAEVLGIDDVGSLGVDDNFFDLGGDSILSIQLVFKAKRAGLAVSAKDLFLHQTIRRLAEVAGRDVTPAAKVEMSAGPVPLTPIQLRLFETHPVAPHHHNQSMLAELTEGVDEAALRAALAALVAHHDALRMRFEQQDGQWRQRCAPVESGALLQRLDLSEVDDDALRPAMDAHAAAVDSGLDLAAGPLLRALLFDRGPSRPPWLFLTVHHLVVDAVSWRILIDDLDTAYRQVAGGEPVDLGARTTSFGQWADRLVRHVADGALDAESAYWAGLPDATPLPVDGDGPDVVASTENLSFRLDERETAALLRMAPAKFRARVNDVLLAGLAWTLCRWGGQDRVLVDLEGHGREAIFDDVDLTRTVGWFTTMFPVVLSAPADDEPAWPAMVRSVRDQLRAVPGNGLSYGALRYLRSPGSLGTVPVSVVRPQVVFNYHSEVSTVTRTESSSLYRSFHEPIGREQDPGEQVTHPLGVVGAVRDGRMEFDWYYSAGSYRRDTVESVAGAFQDALRALARHCDPALATAAVGE